ncbi:hypothetical protein BDY19DRAFT_332743 [Irpex rosettiformis]|uniref:Uncharacterized protein n=1 Tax=Irpex rosettiformis TaxID=378272 RepID=A0ACB8TY83_9APHY|nr:hypothetical protein BDY19DRAFT_332743 [Irpex rosettiformis]
MVLSKQEKYLAALEVPDLASLIDRLNRPSSKWSSDAQASSLAIDTLKIESASQHPEPRPPATSRISQAQAEARPQPSFEVEWNTRIIRYDAELRNTVKLEDLSLDHLDGQFASLSIHPSSFPDNTGISMFYTGSQEAVSSVNMKVHLESSTPESPSPEPFTFNAGSYRKASSGSRGRRTTGAMPNLVGEEFTTGVLGELYIFYLLSKKLPQFTAENWTSEMRYYASACKLDHFTGDSTADFYYEDTAGVLTKLLLGEESSLTKKWSTRYPRYHLEVKATTGNQYTPFHLSRKQLETASKMTIRDLNAVPEDVYVLIRVWNVRPNDLQQVQYQAYLDPHRLLYNGKLRIESEDGVSVVIRE